MSQLINLSPGRAGRPSRRTVLKGGAALVLGFHLPLLPASEALAAATSVPVNAWLEIAPESVTVLVASCEMGQGVFTALPMLVAEELDIDWQTVRAEMAPLDAAYVNPLLGGQRTEGSSSMRAFYLPLRQAGAAARLMLMAAAARVWRVPMAELTAASGVVSHADTDRRASYGALARLAARQPVPEHPPLKDPSRWTLIGRPLPRLDTPAKILGQASFGQDVRLPDLLYAAIRHCPVVGGTLARFDASALKAKGGSGFRGGVAAVVPLADAVAVVADGWWQARSALAEVTVAWTEGADAGLASTTLDPLLARSLEPKDPNAAVMIASRGEIGPAMDGAASVVESVYSLPFLAHAPLEPMNATASVTAEGCELWLPTQDPGAYATLLPPLLGIRPGQVKVNTTFLGGSFGRRLESDFGIEAALLSQAVRRPVQLIWSREEDIRRDFFRPASVSRVSVGLDVNDRVVGWRHRIAAPSILAWGHRTPAKEQKEPKEPFDPSEMAGIADQPYDLPVLYLDAVRHDVGVPVGVWRSSGHGSNAFAVESMIDELATADGRDPYRFRRHLLAAAPRAQAVLDLAAGKSGWEKPLAGRPDARRGRGMAFHQAYGSIVAAVAEITVFADGHVKVDRVVGAIDCGLTVNPDLVAAQLEGGLLFGLSAALYGKITFEKGRVVQSNFHDVKVLSLATAPGIEVHLVESQEPPSGVEEAGTPPIAPALTNAIFAATGRRLRSLPLADHDLSSL